MPAPTLTKTAPNATPPATGGQAQPSKAASQVIPFTRASRKKTKLLGQFGPLTLGTSQQAMPIIQAGFGGYLRFLEVIVTGTTSGNTAAVAFNNDGPFNVLQQITFTSPNGDSIISLLDGFGLYALNKYGAFARGAFDPVASPSYSAVSGTGATGGSFQFILRIPIEVDSRDAYCALKNQAANQQFNLQVSLQNLASLYTTAPTTAPSVNITAIMHYWSQPAGANSEGNAQATAPAGDGSLSLIQTQTPTITPGSQQNIQLLNVGNTIRFPLFILRNGSGVRTEADWPNVTNFYVNNDLWYYKLKSAWRQQHAAEYGFQAAPTASPTAGALDNGVYPFTDFINDGTSGDEKVNGAQNRNLWLVTGPGTAFNVEAVNWGAAAGSFQVIENVIKPSSPVSMYAPHWD